MSRDHYNFQPCLQNHRETFPSHFYPSVLCLRSFDFERNSLISCQDCALAPSSKRHLDLVMPMPFWLSSRILFRPGSSLWAQRSMAPIIHSPFLPLLLGMCFAAFSTRYTFGRAGQHCGCIPHDYLVLLRSHPQELLRTISCKNVSTCTCMSTTKKFNVKKATLCDH